MSKQQDKLSDVGHMLRLEVALPHTDLPLWYLLDWVRPGRPLVSEMMRLLSRFNRIVLSLERQANGTTRAKNEPYERTLGVRCKMGRRIIGVHVREAHQQLATARTATASECPSEVEFAVALASMAQELREAGTPPPARESSADRRARRAPQSPEHAAAVTEGSNVDRK